MNKRKNIKLVIEYQGTDYCGWQIQPNGLAVQEVLKRAVKKVTRETVTIIGSGRTDAGVHAQGQVANFIAATKLTPDTLMRAINANLPKDVAVIFAERVPIKFHAQYDAINKEYIYTVYNSETRPVFPREIAWHIPKKLDVARMKKAAKYLLGEHDFKAFAAKDHSKPEDADTVRTITKLEIIREGGFIYFEVAADGFLYKMVRNIAGTLVEVGRGKWTPSQVKKVLASLDRKYAGPAAPPHGLCLWKVVY